MVTVYYKDEGKIETGISADRLSKINLSEVLWIDLTDPSKEVPAVAERFTRIKFLTKQQAEEIETTSKYSETVNDILVNIKYYIDKGKSYETEPVSFIISKEGWLVLRSVSDICNGWKRLGKNEIKKFTLNN